MWDRGLGFVNFLGLNSKCMKLWCFLCFNEEDEELRQEGGDYNTPKSMTGGDIFGNGGLPDENVGNNEDHVVGSVAPLSPAVTGREREQQLRLFEEMVRAVRVGAIASWSNTAPRTLWRSEGESSSAAAEVADGLDGVDEDSRDSHHKRAKVDSDYE